MAIDIEQYWNEVHRKLAEELDLDPKTVESLRRLVLSGYSLMTLDEAQAYYERRFSTAVLPERQSHYRECLIFLKYAPKAEIARCLEHNPSFSPQKIVLKKEEG